MVYDTRVCNVIVAGETAAHNSATPESSLVANVICTKGTRHGRPFGDQLKWQTVCRAVAMETRRVRQCSSTGPCHPWQRQMSLVLSTPHHPSTTHPPTDGGPRPSTGRRPPLLDRHCAIYIYYILSFAARPPPRRRRHRHRHRRLFCSQPTAIEFFLRKTNPAVSLCIYAHPHTPTHTHSSTVYMYTACMRNV